MSTVINLRVPDEDAVSWRASAKAEGVSLSRWIRDRVGTPVLVSGTPRPVRDATVFVERAKEARAFAVLPARSGKLDPRCVQAQYHWKGFCKVCG